MVFNATLNNISVISWRSVLLVEATKSMRRKKRKHQLTIKTCIKYVDKKSPVMRPNLQPTETW
jgi:hypothetical protein